jgi:hypothetical protein
MLLVLLVPIIGYLVVWNVEQTRHDQDAGAQTDAEAQLIGYMRQQFDAQHKRFGFHWSIARRDTQSDLVCYCDGKGYGWWYQVQIAPDGQFTATQVADTSAASTVPQQPSLFPTPPHN